MYALRVVGGSLFTDRRASWPSTTCSGRRGQGALIANEEARGAAAGTAPAAARAGAWHRALESRPVQFAVLTFVAVV